MTHEQANCAFTEKLEAGVLDKLPATITNEVHREDRVAEAVALVWEAFSRKAVEDDEVMDDALMFHAARLRAVDYARHFVRRGRRRCLDVLDPRAYHRGHVEVHHIDLQRETDLQCPSDHLDVLAAAGRVNRITPEQEAAFRLDGRSFLDELPETDRELLSRRAAGEKLAGIGSKLGWSTTKTCRRLKALELEYRRHFDLTVEA